MHIYHTRAITQGWTHGVIAPVYQMPVKSCHRVEPSYPCRYPTLSPYSGLKSGVLQLQGFADHSLGILGRYACTSNMFETDLVFALVCTVCFEHAQQQP